MRFEDANIVAVHDDGTFDIQYFSDKSVEKNIQEIHIRPHQSRYTLAKKKAVDDGHPIPVGTQVMVRWKKTGIWYVAVIRKFTFTSRRSSYRVTFSDTQNSTESYEAEWFDVRRPVSYTQEV